MSVQRWYVLLVLLIFSLNPVLAEVPSTPPSKSPVVLKFAVMCKAVDPDGKPLEPVAVYAPGDTFCCSAQAFDIAKGSRLEARWHGGGGTLLRTTVVLSTDPREYCYVWFNLAPAGKWDAGLYTVDLYADGRFQTTVTFFVKESNSNGATRNSLTASWH